MALTEQEIDEIRRALVQAVTDAGPTTGLIGAHAGTVVQRVLPGLRVRDHGYQNLSEFIARHVPELAIVRRQGLDVVYALASTAPSLETASTAHGAESRAGESLWRIWVSPASAFTIAVSKSTPRARPLTPQGELAPDEVRIQPASAQLHRQLGREFLTGVDVDEVLRTRLQVIVDNPNPRWWQAWNDVLRSHSEAEYKKWHTHRNDALQKALENALLEAGLDPAHAAAVLEAILLTRGPSTPADSATASVTGVVRRRRGDANTDLVTVIQAVVARMSESELRSLELPVGLVYDVLTQRPRS